MDALAELETRFLETFAALSKCARDVSFFSRGEKRDENEDDGATTTSTRFSGLARSSKLRRSRLAFVRARVRVRVDAFPDARPNVCFPGGPNSAAKGKENANANAIGVPCALELVAPRAVFFSETRFRLADAAGTERQSEKRVDARGAALTYVDAMDPTTPQCEGFADAETTGDAPPSRVAGSSADGSGSKKKGTDERKRDDPPESRREKKTRAGETRVAVASFRWARAASVSGWRFSGDDAAAAAEVAPN